MTEDIDGTRRRAADMRAERRRELDLCTCAWPVVVYRNTTGHDSACPAHLDWIARRDALRSG